MILNEGSWGYEPMNSDGAWDLLAVTCDSIFEKLDDILVKALKKKQYDYSSYSDAWNAIGVGMLYIEKLHDTVLFGVEETYPSGQFFTYSEQMLDKLAQADEWIGNWREADAIRKSIETTKKKLDSLCRSIQKDWKN